MDSSRSSECSWLCRVALGSKSSISLRLGKHQSTAAFGNVSFIQWLSTECYGRSQNGLRLVEKITRPERYASARTVGWREISSQNLAITS